MNIDYIQSEIEKYQQFIIEDDKKIELIKQNKKYNERCLKNAQGFLKELTNKNGDTTNTGS